MLYLINTKLSSNDSIIFALVKIYGINKKSAQYFCKKLGFVDSFKISDLTNVQTTQLQNMLENSDKLLGSKLKQDLILKNKLQIKIKSYKGLRKLKGYPVRGQRTRSNAKTSRKKY